MSVAHAPNFSIIWYIGFKNLSCAPLPISILACLASAESLAWSFTFIGSLCSTVCIFLPPMDKSVYHLPLEIFETSIYSTFSNVVVVATYSGTLFLLIIISPVSYLQRRTNEQ